MRTFTIRAGCWVWYTNAEFFPDPLPERDTHVVLGLEDWGTWKCIYCKHDLMYTMDELWLPNKDYMYFQLPVNSRGATFLCVRRDKVVTNENP